MSASIRRRSFYAPLVRIGVAALGTLTAAASFAAIQLPTEKAALIALGEQHRTAWDLYKDFQSQANGGQRLNPARLPDWTGVYSRSGILFNWDQDQGRNRMPTAKLTPEYEKRLVTKLDNIEKGIEFDNLSNCAPPGHPRPAGLRMGVERRRDGDQFLHLRILLIGLPALLDHPVHRGRVEVSRQELRRIQQAAAETDRRPDATEVVLI